MDEQKVRDIIRQELAFMLKKNKLVFPYPMQILDGNDIVIGGTNGTRIGSDQSLIGFFGNTPIPRFSSGYLVQPTGGSVVDNEARATINDMKYLIDSFGFSQP